MVSKAIMTSAQKRFNTCFDLLFKSELTIVHYPAGEDHCCVDLPEALAEKKSIAKKMAQLCIDTELKNHSSFWIATHPRRVSALVKERSAVQTL